MLVTSSPGLLFCLFKILASAHLLQLNSLQYNIEEGAVILVKKDTGLVCTIASINLPYVLSWFPFIAVSNCSSLHHT